MTFSCALFWLLQSSVGCAVLRATPALTAPYGLVLTAPRLTAVVYDHVVLDGSRFARLATGPAAQCNAGTDRTPGFNTFHPLCTNCRFTNSVSMWALCGKLVR